MTDWTDHRLVTQAGVLHARVLRTAGPGEIDAASAYVVGHLEPGCLVRIQSRCLYGEVLGSVECDCGPQLRRSVLLMRREGSGVLIYLDQEGRAGGLHAKAVAYQRAEQARIETFATYENEGLPADLRSYESAVCLLASLGLSRIRLLTNNPDKVRAVEEGGIEVEPVPLVMRTSPEAWDYLVAKRQRGHALELGALSRALRWWFSDVDRVTRRGGASPADPPRSSEPRRKNRNRSTPANRQDAGAIAAADQPSQEVERPAAHFPWPVRRRRADRPAPGTVVGYQG